MSTRFETSRMLRSCLAVLVIFGLWSVSCGGERGRRGSINGAQPPTGPRSEPRIHLAHGRLCVVTAEGRLWCFGANNRGQLGDGTNVTRAEPFFVSDLTSVAEVALGRVHTCARLHSGEVYCWGDNAEGQLGDGTVRFRFEPTRVPGATSIVGLSASGDQTLAIGRDGEVLCWGTECLDVPLPPEGADESEHLSKVLSPEVMTWRNVDESTIFRALTPRKLSQYLPLERLTSGARHSCGIDGDGRVLCTGENRYHQLGTNRPEQAVRPRPVPGVTRARDLSIVEEQTCALQEDGAVICWGPDVGSRGGDTFEQVRPATVTTLKGAVRLARDRHLLCGATREGRVACSYPNGRLLSGLREKGPIEAQPFLGVEDAVDLSIAVGGSLCILRRSGSVLCEGALPASSIAEGSDSDVWEPQRIRGLTKVKSIAAGYENTCAILEDGSVSCWGRGSPRPYPGPFRPYVISGFSDAVEVVVGDASACAKCAAEPGKVYCWRFPGRVTAGLLKHGELLMNGRPTAIEGLDNATTLAFDYEHACTIRREGRKVSCWGLNNQGQLGDGTKENRLTPVDVVGLGPVKQVAVGMLHSCALRDNGEILCWGVNGNGQLGDGTTEGRMSPTKVLDIDDAVEIGAGARFTCARRSDGSVYCWGQGCDNQLGIGQSESQPRPIEVVDLPPATELRVGAGGSCIRSESGEERCWGRGRLEKALPAEACELAPGWRHFCAALETGEVYCWGDRTYLGGETRHALWLIDPSAADGP